MAVIQALFAACYEATYRHLSQCTYFFLFFCFFLEGGVSVKFLFFIFYISELFFCEKNTS